MPSRPLLFPQGEKAPTGQYKSHHFNLIIQIEFSHRICSEKIPHIVAETPGGQIRKSTETKTMEKFFFNKTRKGSTKVMTASTPVV